jgi:2,4-dienoyl-CoA reductase-like NADH-dependent reductase (Old Yellow Enzyme family)/pyruvate/2-oxoglutarate dehydrogenase complex dihydrolipoamide dehydrogenase (E3) component
MRYPHVFSEIEIGPIAIKNRFYFSPQGSPTSILSAAGRPTEEYAAYLAERAAGGVGLIIHSLNVFPRTRPATHCPWSEDSVPAFAAVASAVHAHGAKIFGQLNIWRAAGKWDAASPPAPRLGVSASGAMFPGGVSRAMRRDDIEGMREAFRRSARNLAGAGYDGIELHCTHGMLLEQFLSPRYNLRTDEYGGSLENRMRVVVELLRGIRDDLGGDLAVGIRYNCDEFSDPGLTQDDAALVVERLAALGLLDFVDVDVGIEPEQMHLAMPSAFVPRFYYKQFAAPIRKAVPGLTLLCALGRVSDLADAEAAIAEGAVDLVGAARALIAEPHLVENARLGRERESLPCIGANLCLSMVLTSGTWGCAVNPATGRELTWGRERWQCATQPGRVVVIGAGPAGLEAARVAALRGHEVTLLERRERIGGQLRLWASLPGRESLAPVIEWYSDRLADLGVDVRLESEASAAAVGDLRPDAIIVATGARYVRTGESGFNKHPIPGWDRPSVLGAEDVIERRVTVPGRVVVFDDEGLNAAVGAAEILANEGSTVVIVTHWPQVARELNHSLELPFVMQRLRALGVSILTETDIASIGEHDVSVYDVWTNETRTVEDVAGVVMAAMRRPEDSLLDELEGTAAVVLPVGDAAAPRTLSEATYEAQRFARMLGEPDAPASFAAAYWPPSTSRREPAETTASLRAGGAPASAHARAS